MPSKLASVDELIDSAQLTAIEHLQLHMFLIHAIEEDDAVNYVLRESEVLGRSLEESLRGIIRDLQTLARKCMEKHGTFFVCENLILMSLKSFVMMSFLRISRLLFMKEKTVDVVPRAGTRIFKALSSFLHLS